jgi:tetratricopeptide (TPR) repeat protein
MRTALERFTEAIELDPSYAPAYASLSNAYALSLVYMYDIGVSPYEAAGRSVALAARATELDPGEAAAHTARGYIRGLILQDLDEAASAFEAALAIAPNAPDAPSWSVRVLEARGAMAEAFREAERARALDPFHPARRLVVTGLALVNGDYPLSIREAREAMRLEPTLTLARAMEGRALALAGRGEECAGMDFGVYRVIRALCLASSGRLSEADSLVASEELALEDGVRANPEYWDVLVVQDLAAYHGFTGEASEAARWVREAYARSPFGIDARVLESALFDAVRDDPAFADAVLQGRSGVWTAVLEESARFGRSLPRP